MRGSAFSDFIRAAGYRSGRLPAAHGSSTARAARATAAVYRARRQSPAPTPISRVGAVLTCTSTRHVTGNLFPIIAAPAGDGAVNSVVVPGVRFQAHF